MRNMRNAYNIWVRNPEGEKLPGRPSSRWYDDIKMELEEMGQEGVDWIHLVQNGNQLQPVAKMVMNFPFQ
jgi:hypothetical protein